MGSDFACVACGVPFPAGARFCAQCGVRLHHTPARDAESMTRPSVERRQLTVMFCDLVGSTRLSLELDAEELTGAINAYRDACVAVVQHWRGFIARYVGDGVLIYFGFPHAAEDDAFRAVVAAWELSRTIAQLQLQRSDGGSRRELVLQARIGLHTGLVVVGDMVGRESHENAGVLGAAPNIAARLQSLCQPGEIVLSDTTAALLPPTILLRAIQPPERVDFGPVRPFCVTEVPSDPMARRPLSSSGLLGRNSTLQKLDAALRGEGARPVALFVCGEPGIGKSRLLHELLAQAQRIPVCWIRLACTAYGQLSPLHPFREWLGEADAVADASEQPSGHEHEFTPYDRRRRIFQNLRDSLLSRAPRIGLVMEDLHWADSTTLEFLADLLATKPDALTAVLMTSRESPPEAISSSTPLALEMLQRLTPGDSASLARSIETPRPLTAFELAEIVRHADGVPLFIEEFVRGITARDPGADGIPITLRDSLMGALDMLGTARTVTLCASVFGMRFEYGQLRTLLELDDGPLVEALEHLVRARVLIQIGQMPAAAFEFRHALLRETAYHTLLKSERVRWHRRLAELTAAGLLACDVSMPEVLATHCSLGGDSRGAIQHWLQAQDRAMKRSAHVEALAHVRSGLEDCRHLVLADPKGSEMLELELLRRLAPPLIAISGWSTPELETIYARAMQLCSSVGAAEVRFELERGLYNMHLLRSDLRTAAAMADRLLHTASEEARRSGRNELLLVALRAKALAYFYRGEFEEARTWLLKVLSLHDPVQDVDHAHTYGTDPVVLAHSYLAWIDAAQGNADSASLRCETAIEHARAQRHVFSLCYALCFAASAAQLSGDVESAASHSAECLLLGNRHNFQYWIAWAQAIDGWLVGLQSPERGLVLIDNAIKRYQSTGSPTLVLPYFQALACKTARAIGTSEGAAREAQLLAHVKGSEVRFWLSVLGGSPRG